MRIVITLLFVLILTDVKSQRLQQHILAEAGLVAELSFPEILESLPLSRLEESKMGAGLLANLSEMLGEEVNSFRDVGINLDEPMYMFTDERNDNLYFIGLLSLTDATKVEALLTRSKAEITSDGAVKTSRPGGPATLRWNTRTLSIIIPAPGSSNPEAQLPDYLSPSPTPISRNATYRDLKEEDAALSFLVTDMQRTLPQFAAMGGAMNAGELDMISGFYENYKSASIQLVFEEEQSVLSARTVLDGKLAELNEITSDQKFNKNFFKYVDLSEPLGYFSINMNMTGVLEAYPKYFSEELVPMLQEMEMNEFNSEPAAEEIFEEAEEVEEYEEYEEYKQEASYTESVPVMAATSPWEEIKLGISLFSAVVDEEEIGELIRGDLFVAVSDLSEKEVEYVDYEYDEDFNEIPVTRTKTEMVPDFILMASTKEGDLTESLTSYLSNKKLLQEEGPAFKMMLGDEVPFDLYIMLYDDIFFMGTSAQQMRSIAAGNFNGSVPRCHKRNLKRHFMSFFSSPEKLKSAMPLPQLEESPDIYLTVDKFKGTTSYSEIIVTTPEGYDNGLDYVMGLLEK